MNIAQEAWLYAGLFWVPVGVTIGILGCNWIDRIIEGRKKR